MTMLDPSPTVTPEKAILPHFINEESQQSGNGSVLEHLLATQPRPSSRPSLYSDILFFLFLGPHLQHMEVPRLGIELELQLPAYTTATTTRDP